MHRAFNVLLVVSPTATPMESWGARYARAVASGGYDKLSHVKKNGTK